MRLFSLLASLLFLLAGCSGDSGGGAARYEPPGQPGGRLCASQCRSASDYCASGCGLQERVCLNQMQGQAIADYEAYARAQFKARAPMELRPRDFENAESCSATSCRSACEASYNHCFEQCGGKIIK